MRLELELKNSTWAKSPLMKLVSIKEDVGVLLDLSDHEICFVHKIGCDLGGHDIRFTSRQEKHSIGQSLAAKRTARESSTWHNRATWHGTPVLFFCLFHHLLLRLGTLVLAPRGPTMLVLEFWAIKPNNLHLGPKSPITDSASPSLHPEGCPPPNQRLCPEGHSVAVYAN